MKQTKFQGIFPAVITPFDQEGNVDFESLRNVVRFHLEKGVHGFFACGTAGEGPSMSIEERKAVAEAVVKEVAGRVPVIVHVGTTNTKETVELAKHAEKIGSPAVGAVSPYYFKPDLEGLVEHYRLIAEAVGIPVFVYNIPRLTGFNITPEMVRRICTIENVKGVKDTSDNLIQLQEIIETAPKPITVINGSDWLLFAALMVGVDGQISSAANVIPEVMVELYELFKKKEYGKALNLQAKINAVKKTLEGPPIAPVKAALELRGVKAGVPKRPLRPLKPEEIIKLSERLKALNLYW